MYKKRNDSHNILYIMNNKSNIPSTIESLALRKHNRQMFDGSGKL